MEFIEFVFSKSGCVGHCCNEILQYRPTGGHYCIKMQDWPAGFHYCIYALQYWAVGLNVCIDVLQYWPAGLQVCMDVLQYWPAGGVATGQEDCLGLQRPHGSGLWPAKSAYMASIWLRLEDWGHSG